MNDRNTDYRGSLNLPQTDFPMQANLARREPERLARWQSQDLYRQVQQATAGRPLYRLVDGPPYANGDLHIGHAVNKVLKDIVCKVARLDGHHAPFVPGWDCHGLPIELQVEKQHGKVGPKEQGRLDAARFRELCREYALSQIDRQRGDFKRLGVLADWDNPYLTMNPAFEAEQLRVLARIVENGHLVRGGRPVHWCLDCHSSLAEAEVEYQDKTSDAIDVAFEVVIPEDLIGSQRVAANALAGAKFVIWTTTPWTLPGNQAICVHPALAYILADFGALGHLIVAEKLLEACAARYGVPAPRVLQRFGGNELYGFKARHPFAERTVSILLGEHVTLEAGTGLVHTAPAHGLDDYKVCRSDPHLPLSAFDSPVGDDGCFVAGTPLVAGVHVCKADAPIIDALRERGALVHHSTVSHSYPHCWRHKTPLIFRATRQWFIAMDAAGLRARALEAIGNTKWIPGWGENRIREMVAGRPDWCISRQRYWGVPLAFFLRKGPDDLFDPDEYTEWNLSKRVWHLSSPAEEERRRKRAQTFTAATLRRVADAVEHEGANAWFEAVEAWARGDGSGLHRFLPEHLHAALDARVIEPARDTLDVWFDSG
ncbi:MAG: class I tRNA ligase family protein, partial [Gammaproteobacteria bacterium]|nr:class I tRNA ligase family protein [Gammaproteobacteria bacterium]